MKPSLIKAALSVWARALGIYLLVTLVSIAIPPMYFISAGLALLWSLPGLLCFYGLLFVLKKCELPNQAAVFTIILSAPVIAFGCTVLAAIHYTNGINTWQEYQAFCLFPITGIVASIISVVVAKSKVMEAVYANEEDELFIETTLTDTTQYS